MNDWAIGLSTGCYYHKGILEGLETVKNSGFDLLEISSFPAHLDYRDLNAVRQAAERIQELGLEPFSLHAPFSPEIDITALDQDQRDHSLRELLSAARAAAVLGVSHFTIHAGPEIEGKPPQEEIMQHLLNASGVLEQVAAFCREHGMTLMLENLLPHLLFGSTADLLWLMGALNHPNVGICLDTGHAYLAGDLYTAAHKLSGHLRLVHISDNRGQEDDHLPPGSGKIDWERMLASLAEAGFHGALVLELAGREEQTIAEVMQVAVGGRRHLRETFRRI